MKKNGEISIIRKPESGTGQVFSIKPTPRLELNTLDAVRREMARLYRNTKAGNIPTADASRLAFVLAQIAKLIEIGTLEKRIARLENEK